MASDAELLDAWKDGDASAADALIARHFEGLYRFFSTKLESDAEDLVQRTLLACLEGHQRIGDAGFRAYLFGVARNQLNSWLRSKYRAGKEIDLAEQSIADLATSPTRRIAREERQRLLVLALQSLPVDTQILLELAYWERLSGKEIADAMGVGENTVRSRLARARVALRASLDRVAGREADALWASFSLPQS